MKPEETIDFHIRWAWLRISRMYNQLAAPHGLTQSIGFILLNIDPRNGIPATHLGPKMGMEATSLSRALRNMEERGWIERKPDLNDKRISRIFLTKEGERLRNISRGTVVTFNQELLAKIPPKKLRHFFEVLSIVDQHVSDKINSAQ